jgi:glycosyltransferase involved in cell wall biosynthesis
MSVRRGGLFVARPGSEADAEILLEALELYPGARIDIAHPGQKSRDVRRRMQCAAYLVLPGLTYELEPQELVLAFAEGLPVIASRLPVLADMLEPGRNALVFEAGSASELARRLAWAEAFPEKMRQMGECAQADYQARFVAHWGWRRLYGERRRQARPYP